MDAIKIECFVCKKKVHVKCSKISRNVASEIVTHKNIKWSCDGCHDEIIVISDMSIV